MSSTQLFGPFLTAPTERLIEAILTRCCPTDATCQAIFGMRPSRSHATLSELVFGLWQRIWARPIDAAVTALARSLTLAEFSQTEPMRAMRLATMRAMADGRLARWFEEQVLYH